jgi:hypothetical protein
VSVEGSTARKKPSKSPLSRSLEHLRAQGFLIDVTERRIPYSGITRDFLGCVDAVGLHPDGRVVAVQATSGDNVAARVRKITEDCHHSLCAMRACGWTVVVHGWRKSAQGRWTLREVDVS